MYSRSICTIALGPAALATILVLAPTEVDARPGRLQVIASKAVGRRGYRPPAGVTLERSARFLKQQDNWLRVTVQTKRGRIQQKIYVYPGQGKPLLSATSPIVLEDKRGNIIAKHVTTGTIRAKSKRVGDKIVTEVRHVRTGELERVTYDPRKGFAKLESFRGIPEQLVSVLSPAEAERLRNFSKPQRVVNARFKKNLAPGLELYQQIAEPRTRVRVGTVQ